MSTTKSFPLRDVLTVTTCRLLTKPDEGGNGIGALYELLGWMTNDAPYTHQLPRFNDECKPWLLKWFPELDRVDASLLNDLRDALDKQPVPSTVDAWLARVQRVCGLRDHYNVPQIPRGEHARIDPITELMQMHKAEVDA